MILRPLTVADEAVARTAHAELAADDFPFLLEDVTLPWPTYVARLGEIARRVGLAPDRVPATFLVAEVDGEIVGRTSIRHELNDFLADFGGHIGYGVRPAYRRRGYATEILRQSLDIARSAGIDSALVICDDDNAGSAGTVERCGGVLERVADGPEGHSPIRRYWIRTS
jgi:predicted acetyltransferase